MGRQREWQKHKIKQGICGQCGKHPLLSTTKCQGCLETARVRYRNRYRACHGIALDTPLQKTGRPTTKPKEEL